VLSLFAPVPTLGVVDCAEANKPKETNKIKSKFFIFESLKKRAFAPL
jgi:hypothetical protein